MSITIKMTAINGETNADIKIEEVSASDYLGTIIMLGELTQNLTKKYVKEQFDAETLCQKTKKGNKKGK